MPTLIEVEQEISQHDGAGPKIFWSFLDADANVVFNFLCTIIGSMWAVTNLPDIISDRVLVAPGDDDPEPGSPYTPTEFDDDKFGRHVTGFTNKVTDFYRVADPNSTQVLTIEVPVGTTLIEVYKKIEAYGVDPSTKPELTTLEILEQKATDYMSFGREIFVTVSTKVWAVNVLAKSNGNALTVNQLIALLSTSDTLEKALKSGSLDTARYVLGQLVIAFPQYADIGNESIAAIKDYQGIA